MFVFDDKVSRTPVFEDPYESELLPLRCNTSLKSEERLRLPPATLTETLSPLHESTGGGKVEGWVARANTQKR